MPVSAGSTTHANETTLHAALPKTTSTRSESISGSLRGLWLAADALTAWGLLIIQANQIDAADGDSGDGRRQLAEDEEEEATAEEAAALPASTAAEIAQGLARLGHLADAGALTSAELAMARQHLLGTPAAATAGGPPHS